MSKIFHHTPPLEKFAWPGGYQLLYLVTTHGRDVIVACPECATEEKHKALMPENRGFLETAKTVEGFVNWEGPPETCECCGEEFESEYGDPDEEKPEGSDKWMAALSAD